MIVGWRKLIRATRAESTPQKPMGKCCQYMETKSPSGILKVSLSTSENSVVAISEVTWNQKYDKQFGIIEV